MPDTTRAMTDCFAAQADVEAAFFSVPRRAVPRFPEVMSTLRYCSGVMQQQIH